MRFIVRTCPPRAEYLEYLQERIPNLEVVLDSIMDPSKRGFDAFLDSLKLAGEDGVVHLEDDILLTENFIEKICKVIEEQQYVLIQFFSMRKKDLEVGSRFEPGRTFMMTQCVYYPEGMSAEVLEFYEDLINSGKGQNLGYDEVVALFMRQRGMEYYIHVPSLVDHRVCKSVINPKRSSKRQSLTFQ